MSPMPLGMPAPDNRSGLLLEGGEVSAKTLVAGATGFAGQRPDDIHPVTGEFGCDEIRAEGTRRIH